jgi:hypothetical protein
MTIRQGTRTERDQARQRHQRIVVWGCDIHRTSSGQECRGCADQGELVPRAAIRHDRPRTR